MMRYSPTGYITLNLKKLKFYGGRELDIRAGGRITQTPILLSLYKSSWSSQRRCSIKKLLLKISQYIQENNCLESLFSKVVGLGLQGCYKETPRRCFLVNIAKFFKNTYFEKYLRTAASETHLKNTILFITILLCKNMLSERFWVFHKNLFTRKVWSSQKIKRE